MKRSALYIAASLVTILSACKGTEKKTPTNELVSPVTFAVFGNTGCIIDDGKTFKMLIEKVNSADVDFAVDIGNRFPENVSSSGLLPLWDMVEEDRKQFTVPVYPVAGKNDVFDYESSVTYCRRFGPTWYSFKRNGVKFVVVDTEDEVYRHGFGIRAKVSDEQLEWLQRCFEDTSNSPVVVFMHRPLCEEDPELWNVLIPFFKTGNVDLVVTCSDSGLFDWGMVNGIRVVSTGCTGPVREKHIGLFPHVLFVTVGDKEISYVVRSSDGSTRDGIWITRELNTKVEEFASSFDLPHIRTDQSWDPHESLSLALPNHFDVPVSGSMKFSLYKNTSWEIEPSAFDFILKPGETKTIHLSIQGNAPELGPTPAYRTELKIGETDVYSIQKSISVNIPRPRKGNPVPINARIAGIVPYAFGDAPLRIPVEIDGVDTCGRLAIYRTGRTELPVCLYISSLIDFPPGVNEFQWNGRDLQGEKVLPDSLTCILFVYNKKAPATWVAVGPPEIYGTVTIERTLSGLRATTHDEYSLAYYPLSGSIGDPKSELLCSFPDILQGLPLIGFSYGESDRLYLGTSAGIVCVRMREGNAVPDVRFGDGGYVKFTGYRGRIKGPPSYSKGYVYVGVGGGNGLGPCIVIIDGKTGAEISMIALGDYYGEALNPPSITATAQGVYCAHPDGDTVIHLDHAGNILWMNDPSSYITGKDTDGRVFTYGIGVDQYGFSYVNTPGYSARCAVLGPDGRGLFRVILVQLPGLRVSSVIPMIERKETDGLYFITRGGDVPYIFHVPYTIRTGTIVDEAEFIR
ncbi:MAG TPA: hypothetical protein VMZ04_05735 [Anaerolineae bacterium]|nr:hypothetical protein [Anaerolineae bacterium]